MILKSLIVLVCGLVGVVAFPSGAPETACGNLSPSHGVSVFPQTSNSPYLISVIPLGSSNFRINITSSDIIAGLMLEAFNSNNGVVVGVFTNFDTNTKYICSNAAVTHSQKLAVSSLTFLWNSNAFKGPFYMKGTVVKNYTTFWKMQVASDTGSSSTQTSSQLSSANSLSTSLAILATLMSFALVNFCLFHYY
ncbi:hypothetical protein HELRODRAFT_163508 [Helobdella robusta]|uniref:Reelin domain-containing protein n=1 Tax=Helobdella robusta TaxID=6412 RepID=T1EU54_HELRO|nr:hypothetical protein HELRODRAFT_163508 [Helobdella robusta]ESN96447.1 hypothetical protein HELRODRAFT_163508 [Helobdella robusta]